MSKTFDRWANTALVPGERLAAFESWLWHELETRLEWPRQPSAKARQIGQCRSFVLQAMADLAAHGYLFQPPELKAMIFEKLDAIAKHQKDGTIEDLWPYLKATWQRWVRSEADALRDRAMSVGAHVNSISTRILRNAPPAPISIPEIAAQSIREQAAAARRKARQRPGADATPELPLT